MHEIEVAQFLGFYLTETTIPVFLLQKEEHMLERSIYSVEVSDRSLYCLIALQC